VKVTRVKCAKNVSYYLINSFPKKEFFFIHLFNLFELTNPVVQNICGKKHFRGHNVLQTSLV